MKDIPILNVYYLLCYAWGRVQETNTTRLTTLSGLSTIQDLLGRVLAGGVNHLFRRGIDRGYVEVREDLAGIRGKLPLAEMAKRALKARCRAACEFEELAVDILPNRILRASLLELLRPHVYVDPKIRREVRSAYRRLDGVSRIRLRRKSFGQVRPGGSRRLYAFLLSVCRLLYESSIVDQKTGRTSFRDFRREEATMWALFEDFVTGFYRREQHRYRVNPNGRRIAWTGTGFRSDLDRARIPVMEADVILESSSRRIILDTKFYRSPLSSGRGGGAGKLHSDNLYQLLAYLRNREAQHPGGPKHEGILLYPQVGAEPLRTDVQLEGFRIQARTVNLNRDWRLIHSEMLETIEGAGGLERQSPRRRQVASD